MTAFMGIREAAKQIGVRPGVLRWHLLYGRAADIELRAPNGARLFTDTDVSRLRTLLNPERGPA
jgi:DNA-binding transcriptional MerR regulator